MAKRAFKKVFIKRDFAKLRGINLLMRAKGIHSKISISPLIITPWVAYSDFETQINALSATLAIRQTNKSTDLKNTQIVQSTTIINSLDGYASQVESLANKAAPGDGPAITSIILDLGFHVKSTHGKKEQHFEVIATAHAQATLTNHLPEKKRALAIYAWSYSITPDDPHSWSLPVFTTESKVTLTDLIPDKRGYFKGAVIMMKGPKPSYSVKTGQIPWNADIISALIP